MLNAVENVLAQYSSEELIDEVISRIRAVVHSKSTVSRAAILLNQEGRYSSPQGKGLSVQQLRRFVESDYEVLTAGLVSLAKAADRVSRDS